MRSIRLISLTITFSLVFLIAASPLAAISPIRAQGDAPKFEKVPCPLESQPGRPVECGYLTVPENRKVNNGKTIRIFVLTLKSEQPNALPLAYLAGGPGLSAAMAVEAWRYEDITLPYDFIMVDQRGTGFSEPNLNCPEMEGIGYPAPADAVKSCKQRLLDRGIDLSAYNSAESAADVADLRVAMGYSEWNLYGLSYGTRLALTVLRDHPEGIRAVVLDSVYPPNVNAYETLGVVTINAFQKLWDSCAADTACNETFPNLDQIFLKVVNDLNTTPITVSGQSIETGEDIELVVTGDTIIDRLAFGMLDDATIPTIPGLLGLLAMGNYDFLPLIMGINPRAKGLPAQMDEEGDTSDSEGMRLAVECGEEFPFNSKDRAAELLKNAPDVIREPMLRRTLREFQECEAWGVTSMPDPIENEAVKSSVPTLILTGRFDTTTPIEWAELTSQTLPNSYLFVIPTMSHVVTVTNTCVTEIFTSFLANPSQAPDSACIADLTLEFQTQ
ncbi:MAG: alpha/beta fold hydrolase [Anaerolinea sp.]|nr:alpha/beta fold hydrolase [Anaerolinea sp.]